MGKRVLVTGGAGFIGSHVVDLLIERGNDVVVLDNLEPQVHGPGQKIPDYMNTATKFVFGDVRNLDQVKSLIEETDAVVHLAALVGVGQSMYEPARYIDVNAHGTAIVLEAVLKAKKRPEKMVVASSMSIYGEGAYKCHDCDAEFDSIKPRPRTQLENHQWDYKCDICDTGFLYAMPTDENKPLMPTSVYATSKRDQEELFLSIGTAHKIPSFALRFFNVFGPRQALSNPYTGVAAIFGSRILNGNPPVVYEDGRQERDFIYVKDIARAVVCAVDSQHAGAYALNVGTGKPTSVLQVAKLLCDKLAPGKIEPVIADKFREGDIRHCYACTYLAERLLNFKAEHSLTSKIDELTEWIKSQNAPDNFVAAQAELQQRGLIS